MAKKKTEEVIKSLARHGLTAAGAVLVAKGAASPELVQGAVAPLSELAVPLSELVAGGLIYLISQLWSIKRIF